MVSENYKDGDFLMGTMDEKITGVVDAVVYQSPDGSYTVCDLEDSSGELVTLVGSLPMISEGDTVTAYGRWDTHPTYGKQFRCEYYEQDMPSSEGDILRYLSAGNVKGIGPKTAIKIVEKYGTETFDVIENHPEWLAEMSGISKKKAAQIGESFRESAGARAVIMYCKNICSPSVSMRIYKKWGAAAVNKIKANPYTLCRDISGISFRKADELAHSMGLEPDSPERISAGIDFVLSEEARRGGHTCVPFGTLVAYASDLLALEPQTVSDAAETLISRLALSCEMLSDERVVYLPKYYKAENSIAESLLRLSALCPKIDAGDIGIFIDNLERSNGITFADMQRRAIAASMENGVMILTGGPGTGKTTITRAILSIFESMGQKCALAAPTGRAANRMSEATSHEAQTIHRLLETSFSAENDDESGVFLRDENNTLDEDVFIIDEVSMIDTLLMHSLLRAIKPGARVIFVGDSDQLPSVGAGNVLGDLIDSGCFCTVRLTEIFRQSGESLIVTNAHAVNHGIMPTSGGRESDFFILKRQSDADVAAAITDLCTRRLPMAYGEDIVSKIQVISPSKKGAAGTEEICRALQNALNPKSPDKREITRAGVTFREGDRVMQMRNNYTIEWEKDSTDGHGIFNGDIGVIEEIDTDGAVTVNFDGKRAVYGQTELEELDLSYAITVHKSQGSEYPVVIIPVYGCHPMLLSKYLLYTAITRASRLVILVARPDSLQYMVSNSSHSKRSTGLSYILKKYSGTAQ